MNRDSVYPQQPPFFPMVENPELVDRALIDRILGALADFAPLETTLESIADAVCERLNFHSCAILLEEPETDKLLIEGAAGFTHDYVDAINSGYPIRIQDPSLSEGPSSEAFRTGQPVIVPDTEADHGFRRWRLLARKQGIRSLVSVPLKARGAPIGTLNCYLRDPQRISEQDLAALMIVATHAGIAIEIARMVNEQQHTIQNLAEMTRALEEHQRLLEQTAEIHDGLTDLVLTNQGIQTIAETLARVTGYPVLVQDQFFNVLARATRIGDTQHSLVPLSEAIVARHPKDGEGWDRRTPFELEPMPDLGLFRPRAVAPIVAGRDLLGYVSIGLGQHPAEQLVLRGLQHAATVFALEMVKDRLAHETEFRLRRNFVDDLLTGAYSSAAEIRDRGRYLGVDLTGPFQVVAFDVGSLLQHDERPTDVGVNEHSDVQRFNDVLHGIARLYAPHVLVSSQRDQIDIVVTAVDSGNADRVRHIIQAVDRATERALPGTSLLAGVGSVYSGLDEVAASHREASRVLHVLRRLGARNKTIRYSDLGVAGVLLNVEDPDELVSFARSTLGPVLKYDRKQHSVLLTTLRHFLGANQSIPAVAEELGLHPNTVRYRLRRVEELLGHPLSDMTFLLNLTLASLVLQLIDGQGD